MIRLYNRNQGKMEYSAKLLRDKMIAGEKVLIACPNQKVGLDRWQRLMPDCLFALVGSSFIKPYFKKGKA